jgi:hypothetical protein
MKAVFRQSGLADPHVFWSTHFVFRKLFLSIKKASKKRLDSAILDS